MRILFAVILYFLAQLRFFWIIRAFCRKTAFYVRRFLYQIDRKRIFYTRQLFHFLALAKLGWKDVLLVFLIFGLIYFVPYFACGVDFKSSHNVETAYIEILSVVASVCGVIIGLYYAAVVSLGSDVYSRMPVEAKQLLRKEPIGNAFVWFLSFLTFASIALIASYYYGFRESAVGVWIILVGSGLAIFGFIKLGYNLFFFTDPTILASSALDLLKESFKLAKASSFNSSNPDFQEHYNKQANLSLQSFELLSKIVKDDSHQHLQTESYLGLCQNGIVVLAEYLKLKDLIPFDSKFFQLKLKHKKWYESSDIDVEMHQQIGHLPFEEIRDHDFVENRIVEIVINCIKLNLKQKNYDVAYRALSMMTKLGKQLVKSHDLKIIIDFFAKTEALILENAPKEAEIENSSQDYYLQLIDCLGYSKSELLIAFLQRLEDLSDKKIKKLIDIIPWGFDNKIFQVGLPSFTHELLLRLNKTITYEISIYGKRITPDWYLYNVFFLKYAEQVHVENKEISDFIFHQVDSLKKSSTYTFSEKDKWANLFVCCYLDRMLEHYDKLELVYNRFEKTYDALVAYSKMADLSWPEYNHEQINKNLKDFRDSLSELLSKAGTFFNLYKFSSEYPDYGGKFLHFVGNDILGQLINNQNLDENTFKHFFIGSLVMFDKLGDDLKKIDNFPVENQLHLMIAPMIDLVTMSGLILLMSKFNDKSALEEIVVKYWNNYFKDDAENKLKKISAILSFPESNALMSLPHRHSRRFNWERDLYDYLMNNVESKKEWSRSGGFLGHDYHVVTHPSALIRYLVAKKLEYMHSENDGLQVFVDYYLLPKTKAIGIEKLKFGKDQGKLLERVAREEAKEKK